MKTLYEYLDKFDIFVSLLLKYYFIFMIEQIIIDNKLMFNINLDTL